MQMLHWNYAVTLFLCPPQQEEGDKGSEGIEEEGITSISEMTSELFY